MYMYTQDNFPAIFINYVNLQCKFEVLVTNWFANLVIVNVVYSLNEILRIFFKHQQLKKIKSGEIKRFTELLECLMRHASCMGTHASHKTVLSCKVFIRLIWQCNVPLNAGFMHWHSNKSTVIRDEKLLLSLISFLSQECDSENVALNVVYNSVYYVQVLLYNKTSFFFINHILL